MFVEPAVKHGFFSAGAAPLRSHGWVNDNHRERKHTNYSVCQKERTEVKQTIIKHELGHSSLWILYSLTSAPRGRTWTQHVLYVHTHYIHTEPPNQDQNDDLVRSRPGRGPGPGASGVMEMSAISNPISRLMSVCSSAPLRLRIELFSQSWIQYLLDDSIFTKALLTNAWQRR